MKDFNESQDKNKANEHKVEKVVITPDEVNNLLFQSGNRLVNPTTLNYLKNLMRNNF